MVYVLVLISWKNRDIIFFLNGLCHGLKGAEKTHLENCLMLQSARLCMDGSLWISHFITKPKLYFYSTTSLTLQSTFGKCPAQPDNFPCAQKQIKNPVHQKTLATINK